MDLRLAARIPPLPLSCILNQKSQTTNSGKGKSQSSFWVVVGGWRIVVGVVGVVGGWWLVVGVIGAWCGCDC